MSRQHVELAKVGYMLDRNNYTNTVTGAKREELKTGFRKMKNECSRIIELGYCIGMNQAFDNPDKTKLKLNDAIGSMIHLHLICICLT